MYPFNIGIIASQKPAPVPSYDPDAQAYMDQVLAVGGTLTTTEMDAVNTLTVGLKNIGVWNKLDIFLPILGSTADSCKINLKEPSNLTYDWEYLGGLTFSSTGIKGNGVDGVVRSKWKINNLALSTQDDAHVTVYSKYYAGGPGSRMNGTLDTDVPGYNKYMASQAFGSQSYGGMYTDSFNNLWNPPVEQFEGLMYADTNGATQKFYYSNVLRGTSNTASKAFTNNSGVALLTLYWYSYNAQHVYDERSPDEIRSFSAGTKLNDSERDSMYDLITNYQTELGRAV